MFWGLSEALDLQAEYKKYIKSSPDEIRILLFGSGDPRHVLTTIAKSYDSQTKLSFFVLEGCLELQARNLLLLALSLEPLSELSLRSKTHLFMDIYGNSLIRPCSQNYLSSKAEHFSRVITDMDCGRSLLPNFNLSHFKYKERDALENIFHFWLPKSEHKFNIEAYWRARVEAHLGVRYDYRLGVFDWDLQMRLKDAGAAQICPQEYKHWRDTGIAFTFPEYDGAHANRTLVAGLVRNGNKYQHRGFVGDIVVGPFIAYGLECPDEKMMRSAHGVNQFRATDLIERNLFEIMYEIQERQRYVHDPQNTHSFGSVYFDLNKTHTSGPAEQPATRPFDQPSMLIPNISVTFLSADDVLKIAERECFKNAFDVVFVASNYFPFLNTEFQNIFAENCLLLFETRRYSVERKEETTQFNNKIKDFAKTLGGLEAVTKFSLNLPFSVIKFKRTETLQFK